MATLLVPTSMEFKPVTVVSEAQLAPLFQELKKSLSTGLALTINVFAATVRARRPQIRCRDCSSIGHASKRYGGCSAYRNFHHQEPYKPARSDRQSTTQPFTPQASKKSSHQPESEQKALKPDVSPLTPPPTPIVTKPAHQPTESAVAESPVTPELPPTPNPDPPGTKWAKRNFWILTPKPDQNPAVKRDWRGLRLHRKMGLTQERKKEIAQKNPWLWEKDGWKLSSLDALEDEEIKELYFYLRSNDIPPPDRATLHEIEEWYFEVRSSETEAIKGERRWRNKIRKETKERKAACGVKV